MKLLYGPVIPKALQPFDRCIQADWHIASDGRVSRERTEPEIVSFELTDAGHLLQSHIVPHFPPGWEPDLVLFIIPERYLLPLDLHTLPCPIAVLVEDWYLNFEMLLANRELFDTWIVDHTAVPLFARAGIQAQGTPVFSLNLERFAGHRDEPVLYDVGFIGNLRTSVHTRRAHYLARLAALSDRWRIGIATERYGEDYVRFFRQCSMIFNYSIHGELNMRCYEALACGRLMLLEAANQETPRFLTPGEDYVSYRPEQLESVIAHYATHADERERIAASGERAIRRYGAQQIWSELRRSLQTALADGSLRRNPERGATRRGQIANLVWSVGPPYNHLTVAGDLIQRQLRRGPDPGLLSDLAVLHYTYWLAEGIPAEAPALAEARQLLEQALTLAPQHPVAAYNQGQMRVLENRPAEALESFSRCIAQLETPANGPWGAVAYNALHRDYEKFYHPWFMSQAQLQYALADDPAALAAARHELLLAHACRHAGDLQLSLGQPEAALQSWRKALRHGRNRLRDLVPNYMKLCLESGDAEAALASWAQGIADPLAPELWLMHCWALAAAGRDTAAKAWFWRYACLKTSFVGSLDTVWEQLFGGFADRPDPAAAVTWESSRRALLPPQQPAPDELDAWLYAWCGLSWQLPLEPPPAFGGDLGVVTGDGSHFHYGLGLHVQPQADALWRSYAAASDLSQGRLGIDLLPCGFPTPAAEPLAELTGLDGELYLLLLDEALPLAVLTELARRPVPPAVALWRPTGFDDAEIDLFAEQLEAFAGLELLLLPALSPGEQLSLLQRATRLWLQPQGPSAYYLWWALELGLLPWLSALPDPCPWRPELLRICTDADVPPAARSRILAAWQSERESRPARIEAAAWTLRAWMVRQNCVGTIWTSPTPHLNLAL